jgi:hypothetical protein
MKKKNVFALLERMEEHVMSDDKKLLASMISEFFE